MLVWCSEEEEVQPRTAWRGRRGRPLPVSPWQPLEISMSECFSIRFRSVQGSGRRGPYKGSGSTGPGHPLLHCLCPPVPKLQSLSACMATGRVRSLRCLVAVAMLHKTAMGSASELPILLPGAREHPKLKPTSTLNSMPGEEHASASGPWVVLRATRSCDRSAPIKSTSFILS